MSRNINVPVRSTKELTEFQNTNNGKLIFTSLRGRKMVFLIKNDRLIAVQVLEETESGAIGSIYIGKVQNFSPNLKAYFVEIEKNEMCFLPETELCSDRKLKPGDELPVQIIREPQKTKLATVTARISLSNDYAAVSIGHPGIGYSNKLTKVQKQMIRIWLQKSDIPDQMNDTPGIGLVIRTKAGECDDLTGKDLFLAAVRELLTEFQHILHQAEHTVCFNCICKAPSIYKTALNQLSARHEYQEIVTDDPGCFQELENMQTIPVRLYQDTSFSLEKLYALESKLKTATERRVWLKSGGYLIIEPTEALTVIDVNSGKFEASKKKETEEMIWQVNREAAIEVALQLRLRNLSGIIVVDFINMKRTEDQKALLELLTAEVGLDTALTNVVDITPLGLVEITRKKSYKTLAEQLQGE